MWSVSRRNLRLRSRHTLKPHFPNASESCKQLNPEFFGVVGPVSTKVVEPNLGNGPETAVPRKAARARRLARGGPRIRVTIVALRNRFLDSDNERGDKFLRDAIARSLGLDDSDKVIQWAYGTVVCPGPTGCIVRVETL